MPYKQVWVDEDGKPAPQPPIPDELLPHERDATQLHNSVMEYIQAVDKGGYIDEDLEHFIFEAAVTFFFGKDIWDWVIQRRQ